MSIYKTITKWLLASPQWIKILFTLPFVFALYLYQDPTTNQMYVTIALASHPPSLRVFRGLSEFLLGLFSVAGTLQFWEGNLGSNMIGYLLFQPEKDGGYASFWKNQLQNPPKLLLEEDREEDSREDMEEEEDEEAVLVEDVTDDEEEEDEDDHVRNGYQETFLQIPQPPKASSVFGAALDLLLVFLLCLLCFTYAHTTNTESIQTHLPDNPIPITLAGIAAPIFPLLLCFLTGLYVLFPWHKRQLGYQIIKRTMEAPLTTVTFRDGFLGDILTSTVRPLQDLIFTIAYLCSGLQGWWSTQYTLDQAAAPVEHSWLVYTILLPACMASPLWWRFLQNLRQVYDDKQRWPYLGNALKYFVAAQVALFGVFTPSLKKSWIWIGSFILATCYQIWWDTFMDWNLLVRTEHHGYQLRPNRLYKSKSLYITIFLLNFLLRFCWTLSFLPPQTLSNAGLIVDTFGSDFETFISPILAIAEIIRRTIWGWLRVEWEAMKTLDISPSSSSPSFSEKDDLQGMEMVSMDHMEIESSQDDDIDIQVIPTTTSKVLSPFSMLFAKDLSNTSDTLIIGELCLYATAFTSVGIFAAAYRL